MILKSRFELIWMIDPILPMVKSVRCRYFCSQTYSNKKKNQQLECGLWLAELVFRAFWLASRNLKGWALMMSSYKTSWCRCVHPISLTVILICKYSWFWIKKWKMTQDLFETLTPVSSFSVLTCQLSNVRGLETIKYAFVFYNREISSTLHVTVSWWNN